VQVLQTLLALLITLGILVTIHEWGHFYVARLCGVTVKKFSVGFGKPIWSRTGKDGVQYMISAIPLGGYVTFLDENEGPVEPSERQNAFNNKSVWQRMAIVFAGPAVNLIFAAAAYAFLFGWGQTVIKPTIGAISQGSLAEQAALPVNGVLTAIDGEPVVSWPDVNLALAARVGDTGMITLTTEVDGVQTRHSADLTQWSVDIDSVSPIRAFGIAPWRPTLEPVLGPVQSGSAAANAGLLEGDRVLSVNGEAIQNWDQLAQWIQSNADRELSLVVEREGVRTDVSVAPTLHPDTGVGLLGVGLNTVEWPEDHLVEVKKAPVDALISGVERMWDMSMLTLSAIKKIILGLISLDNLSGPITIAKVAGQSAASGMESFITFLAYLSVSLGVLNLLPIPVLDGGHLTYYIYEVLRGKPLSAEFQHYAARVGMGLLGAVMLLAIFNDLMRI